MAQRWTRKTAKKEALRFKSKAEWRLLSKGSFYYAKNSGIIDQLSSHMKDRVPNPRRAKGWTDKEAFKDAKRFKTIREWIAYGHGSFSYAKKNGIFNDCIGHMERRDVESWTVEKCIDRAKQFKNMKEWRDNDKKSLDSAKRLNCLDQCLKFVERVNRPKFYWKDKTNFIQEIKKFKTRAEFERSPAYSYGLELHRELMDKIFPKKLRHRTSIGENSTRVFLEKLFKVKFIKKFHQFIINPKTNRPLELDGYSQKLKIAFEYGDHDEFLKCRKINKIGVKKVKDKDLLKEQKCKELGIKLINIRKDSLSYKNPSSHLKEQIHSELIRLEIPIPNNFNDLKLNIVQFQDEKITKKKIWDIVKKCRVVTVFIRKFSRYHRVAIALDIMNDIYLYFKKKNKVIAYTKDEVIIIALTCKSWKEFQQKHTKSYRWLIPQKLVSEVKSHFKSIVKYDDNKYNRENVWEKIRESKNIAELQRKHPGAYKAAERLGFIDELRQALKSQGNQKKQFNFK